MFEALTGIGLSTAAGLNAYIPLLTMGLLGRNTDMIDLPASWDWLQNGWVLSILGILFGIEFVADKIPIVDHLNDVIQTVVRPTSGGLAFGAAAGSQTVTVDNPGEFFSGSSWLPITAGVVISFIVHSMKAAVRPVINATTGGLGGPVASTVEDTVSVGFAVVAILFPVLIIVFLVLLVWGFRVLMKRRRRRKAEKAAAKAAGDPGVGWFGFGRRARTEPAGSGPAKIEPTRLDPPLAATRLDPPLAATRLDPPLAATRPDAAVADRRSWSEAETVVPPTVVPPTVEHPRNGSRTGPTEPLTPPADPWAAQDPFHEHGHHR